MEHAFFVAQGKAQRREMAIPFQGVATQPRAAKNVQFVPYRTHHKGEDQVLQEVFVDLGDKLKK